MLIPGGKKNDALVMETAIKQVIVPTSVAICLAAAARTRPTLLQNSQGSVLSGLSEEDPLSEDTSKPHMVFSNDGEHSFMTALVKHAINDPLPELASVSLSLVKHAAATSLIQQPCDVATSYMETKQLVGKKQLESPAHFAKDLEKILEALPAEDRKVFISFLSHLPANMNKSFSILALKKAFRIAGLYPYSSDQMLSQCTDMEFLTPAQATAIKLALPALVEHVRLHGELSDEIMQEKVGDAIDFSVYDGVVESDEPSDSDESAGEQAAAVPRVARKRGRPLSTLVENSRRCILFNHESVTAQRRQREEQKRAEIRRKIDEAAEREAATVQKKAEKAARAEEKKRKAEEKAAGGASSNSKRAKKVARCANPLCGIEYAEDAGEWLGCETSGCNLWFCPAKKCHKILVAHEKLCD